MFSKKAKIIGINANKILKAYRKNLIDLRTQVYIYTGKLSPFFPPAPKREGGTGGAEGEAEGEIESLQTDSTQVSSLGDQKTEAREG